VRWSLRLVAAIVAVVPAAGARGDVVERRGTAPPVLGQVVGVDDAGVSVRQDGRLELVPWDRVRAVAAARPDPTIDRRLAVATELWRGRSRVERGDTALAEPLFERLFEQYRGQTHETALVVAEGLLRCRIARGANALAVVPALETARLRRAGVTTISFAGLPDALDADTALSPHLAPAWASSRALGKLERTLTSYDARGDEVVEALARGYLRAVRQHLSGTAPSGAADPDGGPDHPGVRLLERLVSCQVADGREREAARRRLEADLAEDGDGWWRGWAHFALGASLLRESGVGRRQRGMVHLVHLPARYEPRLPYLTGLALAWLAEASRVSGDEEVADAMQAELDRRLPAHPVRGLDHPVRIPTSEDGR
jgi:hypothetical protein